jgi:hypothetical protein
MFDCVWNLKKLKVSQTDDYISLEEIMTFHSNHSLPVRTPSRGGTSSQVVTMLLLTVLVKGLLNKLQMTVSSLKANRTFNVTPHPDDKRIIKFTIVCIYMSGSCN